MSYILEALKKAERARGFGQIPDIDSPHDLPTPRSPRRWPWVLVVALLMNALVVAGLWIWWRGGDGMSDGTTPTALTGEPIVDGALANVSRPPPVASRSDPTPRFQPAAPPVETDDSIGESAEEPTRPPPAIERRPLRPLPLPDPLAAPTNAPSQALAQAEHQQAEEPPAPAPVPSAAPTVPPEVVELRAPSWPSPPQAEPAWKSLPLWPLVPEAVLRQVKARLVLNVHVYSEIPEERFVLLNMNKYREGQEISEGLKLEEITREGVILAVPNGRFRLESR